MGTSGTTDSSVQSQQMRRAYFLLFTRPIMTQMNRKEANTSPMKACHTTQQLLRQIRWPIMLHMFLLVRKARWRAMYGADL